MYRTEQESVLNGRRESILLDDPVENGILRMEYHVNRRVFQQKEPATCLYYLRQGTVRLSVTSQEGKEAIVATMGPRSFFGEECLAGQPLRGATATTMTQCALIRIEKKVMMRLLHEQSDTMQLFVTHLLSRRIRCEADLVDQLTNSSEKRLARTLLLLSHAGSEGRARRRIPRINQTDLAQMVGTTRSRVSHFMHKFKQRGFIEYAGGELTIKGGLRRAVLHDQDRH